MYGRARDDGCESLGCSLVAPAYTGIGAGACCLGWGWKWPVVLFFQRNCYEICLANVGGGGYICFFTCHADLESVFCAQISSREEDGSPGGERRRSGRSR